jgi:hypothetical protein
MPIVSALIRPSLHAQCHDLHFCFIHTHTHTHVPLACSHSHTRVGISSHHYLVYLTHQSNQISSVTPPTYLDPLLVGHKYTGLFIIFSSFRLVRSPSASLSVGVERHNTQRDGRFRVYGILGYSKPSDVADNWSPDHRVRPLIMK